MNCLFHVQNNCTCTVPRLLSTCIATRYYRLHFCMKILIKFKCTHQNPSPTTAKEVKWVCADENLVTKIRLLSVQCSLNGQPCWFLWYFLYWLFIYLFQEFTRMWLLCSRKLDSPPPRTGSRKSCRRPGSVWRSPHSSRLQNSVPCEPSIVSCYAQHVIISWHWLLE